MPEFIYSSIFGELTKNVQIRFDKVSELNKKLFDNVIFEQFLDWDIPTIGLDFEELIGQYNITVAAPTIGSDAKEAILGTEGLETLKETILTHAITLPMTTKDYRKVLQILDSKSLPDKVKNEQLIKLMWGNVETVVKSVLGKLDLIFCGALSNEGKFTLDETTNPEGGARGLINYNPPLPSGMMPISRRWIASRIFRLSSMPLRIRSYSRRCSVHLTESLICAVLRR